MSLNKLTITESRRFLKALDNKKKYVNIYAMIQHYVKRYDNKESQYLITDNRKALI